MYIWEEIGGQAIFIQADVAEKAQIEAAVAQTLDTFGGVLDVYVTLAGGGFKHTHDLTEMDEAFYTNLFRNHLLSLFHGARAVIPHFKSAGGGAMLTVAAGAAKTIQDGNIAYATMKQGVIGFTRSLARELQPHNIRVNALCPGLVRRSIDEAPVRLPDAGLARKGQPEDVAYATLYLASDESRWVTFVERWWWMAATRCGRVSRAPPGHCPPVPRGEIKL